MQLIFNKTSGGGNKVKINGLPPNERLNLKEATSIILEENYFQAPLEGLRTLFEENGIYYYSSNTELYKFENDVFTSIGKKILSDPDFAAIKKGDSIIFMTALNIYGGGYKIYKLENMLITELSYSINDTDDEGTFFIGDIIYSRTKDSPYKLYKSENFGKTWTDITNQITYLDGLALKDLQFPMGSAAAFNNNECKYSLFYKPFRRIKFDGKTLSKIKVDNLGDNILPFTVNIDNRNNRDEILILTDEKIDDVGRNSHRYALLKANILENEIKFDVLKRLEVVGDQRGYGLCLDSKNKIAVTIQDFDNSSKIFLKKMFVKTYIPE